MSYCRWSDDDFSCDLYCYKDEGNFVTRVAMLRFEYTGRPPKIDFDGEYNPDKVAMQTKVRDEFFERAKRVRIGLPCDGETLVDENILSFRRRLIALKTLGYRFPDRVLAKIDDEIREMRLSADLIEQPQVDAGERVIQRRRKDRAAREAGN
jgi:hypothetical protein